MHTGRHPLQHSAKCNDARAAAHDCNSGYRCARTAFLYCMYPLTSVFPNMHAYYYGYACTCPSLPRLVARCFGACTYICRLAHCMARKPHPHPTTATAEAKHIQHAASTHMRTYTLQFAHAFLRASDCGDCPPVRFNSICSCSLLRPCLVRKLGMPRCSEVSWRANAHACAGLCALAHTFTHKPVHSHP